MTWDRTITHAQATAESQTLLRTSWGAEACGTITRPTPAERMREVAVDHWPRPGEKRVPSGKIRFVRWMVTRCQRDTRYGSVWLLVASWLLPLILRWLWNKWGPTSNLELTRIQ